MLDALEQQGTDPEIRTYNTGEWRSSPVVLASAALLAGGPISQSQAILSAPQAFLNPCAQSSLHAT